ncbi:16S rRNA (guanine966-N2)-methyltransferase [Salirhabdus euzebyi]|uniref:16S rRNA (Guanine966-N2)-methyltransferase n=1 Tax=Salirhabdus euzebyi TaxID=394506 RepID=A0A841Q9U2_9BACI|nr:16S rRNA (guanine(966)-N(2))-methyltransferase RsmD [Salirhabdus euzebyi]MBB6455007.1 16S rRNA (guanine966-N2)-methyltransferase [Salirhabdus euzebyi]
MRVISGKYKGHPLKAVPGKNARPTTDKVKEAIFQVIGPYFDGGLSLDLFAGSGGLGIEALSRGVDKVIFVDKHPRSIQTIYENIKAVKEEERTEVYRTEAFRALKAASKRELVFDLVFLDPPYGKISFEQLFETLIQGNLVKQGSILVCEHTAEEALPEKIDKLEQFKKETYGSAIAVSIYRYL